MPELPEVETVTQALKEVGLNWTITKIDFFRKDLRESIPIEEFKKILLNCSIIEIKRRSKYILIFSHKGCGIFHLGMSGSFLSRKDAETKVPHTHLIMRLSKRGSRSRFLHFVDPRRFGRIGAVVLNNYENHPFLRNLGPEPLELPRLGDYLYEKSRKSSRAIKTFLMDAKNIVGLGNIYVCESLYQARISPFRAAGQVSRKEFQLLGNAIKKTLRKAIKQGGTTLKDFKNTEGNPGYFKVSLKVYGRTGLACENCKDSITLAKQSGRSSWFCSFCQK